MLDKADNAISIRGGGILRCSKNSYVVQCAAKFDDGVYSTLEEATKRWLQLKFEGKI